MSNDCIFCKIINGDFNTEFVYENEHAVVFKDINPKAPVHLLVVPKIHVASLNELEDKNLMGELLMAVKETTKKIGLKSYKTLINTGKEAGQEVFHLHLHILNRSDNRAYLLQSCRLPSRNLIPSFSAIFFFLRIVPSQKR